MQELLTLFVSTTASQNTHDAAKLQALATRVGSSPAVSSQNAATTNPHLAKLVADAGALCKDLRDAEARKWEALENASKQLAAATATATNNDAVVRCFDCSRFRCGHNLRCNIGLVRMAHPGHLLYNKQMIECEIPALEY